MTKAKKPRIKKPRRVRRSEPSSKQFTSERERLPAEPSENSTSEEMIDKTLEDSFPASDPPSWTTGREHSDAVSIENAGDSEKKTRRNAK